jgi:ESCRT-II complex subunit VPS36
MFFTKPDLTSGARPTLLPDETLLFVQDNVGLYEGKYKIAACQKGHAYLTSHRVCYIDDSDPRNSSLGVDLKDVERHEFQAGFLRSSAKITLLPKPLRRGFGSLRQHIGGTSPLVQHVASASSPVSRTPSPPIRAAAPQVDRGTWICPICTFPNPVPSNFDPTIATDAFPLPPCLTCGIKPEFPLILKAAIAANTKRAVTVAAGSGTRHAWSAPQSSAAPTEASGQITCPRCTFLNHPGLRNCEICNAPLPGSTVPSAQISETPLRPVSPGPEIANLSLDDEHENTSFKLSFRAGGEKVFYERLKNAMIQRRWLLQHAPPVPRPEPDPSAIPDHLSSAPVSRPQSTSVGIAGLEQRGLQSRRNNETVLGTAFEDLEALMASAQDIVALAEKFAAESGSGANPLLSESATALGMLATKDMVGDSSNNLYITELSRNLAEYVTDERRGLLRANGGIMGLVDLWANINRTRNGVELISPADFHAATEAWDRLNLPIRLRQFRSGLLVVQPRDWTDDRTVTAITGWLRSLQQSSPEEATAWDWDKFGCGVTAQEAVSRFGWSLGVANEELEMAEERGALCREEGIEGLKFWLNYLVEADDDLI